MKSCKNYKFWELNSNELLPLCTMLEYRGDELETERDIVLKHGFKIRICKSPHVVSDPTVSLGAGSIILKYMGADAENNYLSLDAEEEGPMDQLLTYRIAVGPQQGRKVFTLQTLPACDSDEQFTDTVGKVSGFSLHAGVATKAHQREKLERLCRYITRPAVSEKRLSLTSNGKVRYELKTPWRDGTTHVFFEPLDFIARLAALVPKPRVNLTRFHGVFAPNSKHRARDTRQTRQTE